MDKSLFSDLDDFLAHPQAPPESDEELSNYLLDHSYRDGMEPPPDERVLFYNGIPIGSRGNIIAINGKAKSRKSVLASAAMSSCFTGNIDGFLGFTADLKPDCSVLNYDTEQGLGHWIEGSRRVIRDAGLDKKPEGFHSVHTRECTVERRLALLYFALKQYRPDVCAVDGITDLVLDLNSQAEATDIGGRLMRYSVEFNCLIIVIIHITKGTGYMTGALGTYLEKKCQTAIKVEKDEKDESISWVSCQYARDRGFPLFGIRFNEKIGRYERLPDQLVSQTGPRADNGPATKSDQFKKEFLDAIFRLHTIYQNERSFRSAVSGVAPSVGLGKAMKGSDTKLWYEYYRDASLILGNPDGGIQRAEIILAARAAAPGLDFNNPVDDLTDTNDLPF